jgi:hypothetical protein
MISVTPILINRAMLSLRKAAHAHTGIDQAWSAGRFNTGELKTEAVPVPPAAATSRSPEDPSESWMDTDGHNDVQLDELTQRARP